MLRISKTKVVSIIFLIDFLVLLIVSFLPVYKVITYYCISDYYSITCYEDTWLVYGFQITLIPLIIFSNSIIILLLRAFMNSCSDSKKLIIISLVLISVANVLLGSAIMYHIRYWLYAYDVIYREIYYTFYLLIGLWISLMVINIFVGLLLKYP